MFLQIITFLLQIAAGILVGLCLLRLYMQYHRVPLTARSGNPIGPLIFALTDWLVLPLRRVIPAVGRWDIASLVAALVIEMAQYAILWLLAGGHGSALFILLMGVFGVVRLAVSGLSVLVIVYAIVATVFAVAQLAESGPLIQFSFFLFSGLLWVLPAMLLIKWMAGPRPTGR